MEIRSLIRGLLRAFAVCRHDPAAHLAEPDSRARKMIARGANRPAVRDLLPVVARACKVAVKPSLTVIVVPGRWGVVLLLLDERTAFGAPTEAILGGSPIGSSGPLLLCLAPDGVEEQPVILSDGSAIVAPVVSNVYAVTDPSWSPPKFR
jgi:hypothetical protein